MFCPHCHKKSKVINSRAAKKQPQVWRRRQCTGCGTTWTTRELISLEDGIRISDKQTRTSISLASLTILLYPYLRDHEDSADVAYWIAQTVLEKLFKRMSDHITSRELSEVIAETLEAYDKKAHLRYCVDNDMVNIRPGRNSRMRGDLKRQP